ncbi:MAG TPA: hypothetical protein PKC76_12640 [Saprospiraceae bacterium]|nr:hypothetical protein [Saprospiraceae bacterium]HMP24977.1 hypothetical protein [Saprospiraceae bacterium]
MSRRNDPPPPTPARRSPFRLLLMGIVLFLLVSVALQMCGINIVSTSGEEQLIDRPHSPQREGREVPRDLDIED